MHTSINDRKPQVKFFFNRIGTISKLFKTKDVFDSKNDINCRQYKNINKWTLNDMRRYEQLDVLKKIDRNDLFAIEKLRLGSLNVI